MKPFQAIAFDSLPYFIKPKTIETEEGCWKWTRATNSRGYSCIWYPVEKKLYTGHLLVWKLLIEEPPKNLRGDHMCHNFQSCSLGDSCPHRRCINPAHIEFKSDKENYARSNRLHSQKIATHCKNNHEFTEKNTYIRSNGRRTCRMCQMIKQRRYRANAK